MARSSQGLDVSGKAVSCPGCVSRQMTVLSLVIQGRVLKACVRACGPQLPWSATQSFDLLRRVTRGEGFSSTRETLVSLTSVEVQRQEDRKSEPAPAIPWV